MANTNNEVTTSFKADISDLEKGIQKAKQQIRLANAEFKAASSGMDDWDKSAEGIQKKLEQLDKVLKAQTSILKSYEDQLKLVVKEQGEDSKGADDLRIKIENQKAAINNTNKEIEKWQDALDEAGRELDETGKEAENLDESLEKTTSGGLSAFGVALGNLVANAITNAIQKLKDLALQTIEVGKTFDTSMSKVGAVSGVTGKELDVLRDKAKEMGSTTKFTATEAAEAFNYMAMAGWDTEDMLDGINGVLNLAAASGADLATTSDIVTDALTAMGYGAEDAGRLADVMAAAASNANTNVEMMGETFKYVAPLSGAMGYSMEDLAVAIGLMANAGIKSTQAGTALRGSLSRLVKPTKDMYGVMVNLGLVTEEYGRVVDKAEVEKAQQKVSSNTAAMAKAQIRYNETVQKYGSLSAQAQTASINLEQARQKLLASQEALTAAEEGSLEVTNSQNTLLTNENGEMRSLSDVIVTLRQAFSGLSEEEQAQAASTLFGQEAMSGMLALINASEADFNKLTEAINNSSGSAENMAASMLDNLGGDMTLFQSKLEGTQIALYEKFEPALRSGVEALSSLLDVMNWLIEHGSEVAAAITGVATAVGTFMLIVNKTAILTAFTKGLTAIKTAMLGLNATLLANPIGIVVALIAGLVAAFVVLWNKSEAFRDFWITLWDAIKMMVSDAWEGLKGFFEGVWESITTIWNEAVAFFEGVWTSITEFFTAAWEKIQELWGSLVQFFTDLWTGVQALFSTVAQWINDNVFQPIIQFFKPVITFFTDAFTIIKQLGEGCWNAIKLIWSAVKQWFKTNVIDPVTKFFTDLWNGIKSAASAAWEGIKAVWTAVSTWFNTTVIQPVATFFTSLWEGIKSAASAAWEGIKAVWTAVSTWFDTNIIQPVAKFFTGMWDGLKSGASDAWEGIKKVFSVVSDWFKDVFSKAWQAVKDVFSTGGKIFDGIKEGIVSAFKTVVNGIISALNKIIAVPFNAINETLDKIRNIDIAGAKPFANVVKRFTVPQIPLLEQGGILKRGQIGLLEGNGTEAVVPLDQNRKWIAATAKALKVALMNDGLTSKSLVTNNYNFTQNNTSPKALSRLEIYRNTNNILQFAKGV